MRRPRMERRRRFCYEKRDTVCAQIREEEKGITSEYSQ